MVSIHRFKGGLPPLNGGGREEFDSSITSISIGKSLRRLPSIPFLCFVGALKYVQIIFGLFVLGARLIKGTGSRSIMGLFWIGYYISISIIIAFKLLTTKLI